MIFWRTLTTLWSMLHTRRRLKFVTLVGLLLVTGVMDMGGMLVIFGFIRGLDPDDAGLRSGAVARGLALFFQEPLSSTVYVGLGGLGVVTFIAVKNVAGALVQFALTRFLMKLNHGISKRLLDSYLLAPYFWFRREGGDTYSSRLRKTFKVYSQSFAATARVLSDGITLVLVTLLLLFVDPFLTLAAAAVFGGVGSAVYWLMQGKISEYASRKTAADDSSRRIVMNALDGLAHVRLRDARQKFSNDYSKALARLTLWDRRLSGMQKIPRATNEILLTVMIVGSVAYLTFTDKQLARALPTLALFGFAGLRMTSAMSRLNQSMQKIRQLDDKFRRFTETLKELTPEVFGELPHPARTTNYLANELPEQYPLRFESLQLENAAYRYPKTKRHAVKDICLSIRRGEFVSFCGPSGSGKTTLLLLIMGLLEPTRGTIRCGDWEIRQRIRAWHRTLSYVGQDLFIAQGTVRENVTFALGDETFSDEEVWGALRRASAHDFVEKMQRQLDAQLEGGRGLSGGERQRIVIARALFKNPEVIILDEATAALDNRTERTIADAITSLSGEKTVICVAHRLSTIRNSDTIHYMEAGQVIQSGTYRELLADCPGFRQMVEAEQQSADSRNCDSSSHSH